MIEVADAATEWGFITIDTYFPVDHGRPLTTRPAPLEALWCARERRPLEALERAPSTRVQCQREGVLWTAEASPVLADFKRWCKEKSGLPEEDFLFADAETLAGSVWYVARLLTQQITREAHPLMIGWLPTWQATWTALNRELARRLRALQEVKP